MITRHILGASSIICDPDKVPWASVETSLSEGYGEQKETQNI